MTSVTRSLAFAVASGALLLATSALAQPAPATGGAPDCSRWPASIYDGSTGSCVCPSNMWWNLRGDACLPREHAAQEFCATVWPSSSPYLMSNGGYRCVCAPPLMWNEQATACRPPTASVEMDCTTEWPGTLPVLSPSGTEYECRCPGGRRWDEPSRSCVAGAPVVAVGRSYGDEPASAPATGPGSVPVPQAPTYQQPAPPPSGGSAGPGGGGYAPSAPAPATPPPTTRPAARAIPGAGSAPASECQPILNEMRMRAQAGQNEEVDALGMKAAVAGCDPAAISEATKAKPPAR